jgi:glycosyltransferase involved in cell wall biosynthesis
MKIVIVSPWFSEKMGYAENCLPKAIASMGHEVHLVTTNAQIYYGSPNYSGMYEPFIGPGLVNCGVKNIDGYTLHRLPIGRWNGRLRIKNLFFTLRKLKPEIVQTFEVDSPITLEIAIARLLLGYKLFLESHLHASVFPPAAYPRGLKRRLRWFLHAYTVGRFVSFQSERCYPISKDAADIAVGFLGVEPGKVQVFSLGVDTSLFRPPCDHEAQQTRLEIRHRLGFSPSDIVCIYTGRLSDDKGATCLAQAIGSLIMHGKDFRGLFVGNGPEKAVTKIKSYPGCVVHTFVPLNELPPYYWAADIGVWPKQESTSQLDAVACGLPIILSNRVAVFERVEGNGFTYEEGDSQDLCAKLLQLSDPATRLRMGEYGAAKIRSNFSWDQLARQRVIDFEKALEPGKRLRPK